MELEFKSPRKVEEELRDYARARFEAYMKLVDEGAVTLALGIAALRDESESGVWEPGE